MADDEDADGIVSVSRHPVEALAHPKFIIKDGEKYILTIAVWEYDLAKATTSDQIDGCNEVAELFNTFLAEGLERQAVKLPPHTPVQRTATATGPP